MNTLSKLQAKATSVLRVLLGWLFFYAGIVKVLNPSWSAAGFLVQAKTFHGFYILLAHPLLISIVNILNEWGLLALGVSLILGIWVRFSSLLGALLMLLYYFASNSLPFVPNGFLVDDHIIYAAALAVMFYLNAGRYYGLDGLNGKNMKSSLHTSEGRNHTQSQ